MLAGFTSFGVINAQYIQATTAPPARSSNLPVLVDGSKNPEKISDAIAYQHFFSSIAAHASPTASEQGRQNAQLNLLQLAANDRVAFVTALAGYRGQLDQVASAASSASTPTQLTAVQGQKTALVATMRANLAQALTPDGVGRIDSYVKTRVKAHIMIYGGTPNK